MKTFTRIPFNWRECRKKLDDLGQLLANNASLDERKDLLPFFRTRLQLSAFIGSLNSEIITPDLIAFEYDLFGDFTCDLVVGDSRRKSYSFIEFEDAKPNSIFVSRPKKSTPEWSPRFDHGFSQIIDWFWKLRDLERTHDFEARFGEPIEYNGVLIIGRGTTFTPRENRRWIWSPKEVMIGSRHVNCWTYDQIYQILDFRLAIWI